MLFNSFQFVALVAITFLLYYLPRLEKYQIKTLIVSSLVFYAYEFPALVILLLISTLLNIYVSYRVIFGNQQSRKRTATLGVILNLAVLAFFKYSPLFSTTFFDPSSSLGKFLLSIPLPIGISFFTFEGISLVVDLYKSKFYSEKDLSQLTLARHAERTLFFISFFPHLVAGPILKAHDFLPQIKPKKLRNVQWESVVKTLILGYFLKMVVADNLKEFTETITYPYFLSQSSATLFFLLLGYSFQIFADFAGYSLIAIGLGKMFGYDLQANFNFPYISTSFKEFWKRWHISLSTFLMEYLYFPLGGNRKGKFRTYLNLLITMFLGGLWHGAAWSYAIWGTFHGMALALERFLGNNGIQIKSRGAAVLKGFFVFLLVTFAWLLFKLPNFSDVLEYVKAMRTNTRIPTDYKAIGLILVYSAPVVLYHMAYLIRFQQRPAYTRYAYIFFAILLFFIIANSGAAGSFIYFQF